MRKISLLIALPIAVGLLASCASTKKIHKSRLVPLITTLIRDYKLTPQTLKKLQYYLGSEGVTLERNDSFKTAGATHGRLQLNNADVIKIKGYTLGKCLEVIREDSIFVLGIVFGTSNYNRLHFGPNDGDGGDESYTLYTDEDKDILKYGRLYYDVTSRGSEILVDPVEIEKLRVEPGRKVY